MVTLIVLNIILIIAFIFLLAYIFWNRIECVKYKCENDEVCKKNENVNHKENKKINSHKVFNGRFISDEEYEQIMKFRKSDVSILMEELEREYEHLKELNK
jgi:hypothetical protein